MPRPTAAHVIAQVRRLVGDNETPYLFSDDEIQDSLDAVSISAVRDPLKNIGGLAYISRYQWWESAVIAQPDGTVVSPDIQNFRAGRWEFLTAQSTELTVTGISHDVYGAAVDILEQWAGRVALDFDFSADGASYNRSQKQDALMKLAAEYRRKSRPISVILERDDVVR